MAKQTRRGFLKQTTMSVASVGVLVATGAAPLSTVPDAAVTAETDLSALSAAAMSEPMMAHVRDFATGEISLLIGTQEIIYRDPNLVMRLLKAVM